ncbi:DNA mismatch repair protein MutS, partial [Natronolimnohabitans innermongolicus JCM 12255]
MFRLSKSTLRAKTCRRFGPIAADPASYFRIRRRGSCMDPALGPPAEMAEKRDELTPMMAQYH